MIRIAAVGDVHLDEEMRGHYRSRLDGLADSADVLLLAGDLTKHGTAEEGDVVAAEFRGLGVPVVAVLGNHDYHCDAQDAITEGLRAEGITVLEGDGVTLDSPGGRIGIAGTKGFGGGFAGKCASEFGEPEIKGFVRHGRQVAHRFGAALRDLDADLRVGLTHYAPVKDTLAGEPPEIYPFLGSYLLAEAVDGAKVGLAVHGHAHAGVECGLTPGGVRVRNVALPVLRRPYAVYRLEAVPEPVAV
ncbi:metallophosphoesterase family protein [Marinitenerispora sediminis]|uniref:Metallophosphoesterase n=1 Tax=Marinitenerispora sediminis TaxID=1931232 RepID=A0A368T103_9ACTN|nr:metallophosphoesterase [Marinitenerispora sediminis]RCV49999.1 metallophosphoesterase [Marinitenerispora sediminis]RCV51303.1 metallophosphoesterase [Marinitenerispora sediminis]RCV53202.1 metallophosphoesterase [Marinitenerispora sediminis]